VASLFDSVADKSKHYTTESPQGRWIEYSRAQQKHAQRQGAPRSYSQGPAKKTHAWDHPAPKPRSVPQARSAPRPAVPQTISQYSVPSGTLPYAYAPSHLAVRDNGKIVRGWKIPTWQEVVKDFAFIALETILAALGSALFQFFTGHRRFHPGPGVNG